MRAFSVPVIDIADFAEGDRYRRSAVARLVDDTFVESGFMVIVNHGIAPDIIAEAKEAARAFFALPDDEKLCAREAGQTSRGFFPRDSIASARYGENKDAPTDLMESYALSSPFPPPWAPDAPDSRTFAGENIWPEQPARFREAFERYFAAVQNLADDLLRLFALALRLEEDFLMPFFAPYQGVVRANSYGRLDRQPLPGQLRIGAHADLGGFTVLASDADCGGLQIQDHDGAWHDVEAPGDGFVINIGEFMQAWTNDRWRATRHRVLAPRTDAENIGRLTIPFFVNPDPERFIECIPTCLDPGEKPRYERFKVGDFRERRLAEQQAVS